MKKFNPITYLESLHTKQLLDLRKSMYRLSMWTHKMEDGLLVKDKQYPGILNVSENHQMNITLDDIKKVLSTRPHIPNSQEAKTLRKERAMFNKKPRKALSY